MTPGTSGLVLGQCPEPLRTVPSAGVWQACTARPGSQTGARRTAGRGGCWAQLEPGEDEGRELGAGAHRAAGGLPLLPTAFPGMPLSRAIPWGLQRQSRPREERAGGPGIQGRRAGASGPGPGEGSRLVPPLPPLTRTQGPGGSEGAERKAAWLGTVTLGRTLHECHGAAGAPPLPSSRRQGPAILLARGPQH